MRCRAAHKLDEVVVFLCRVAVALYVADNLAVDLAGGVESERCLDPLVLEVAVDGFGHADNLDVKSFGLIVFGQYGGVGIRVVATDYYESLDI